VQIYGLTPDPRGVRSNRSRVVFGKSAEVLSGPGPRHASRHASSRS